MKTITMEEFLRNPPPFGGRVRADGKVDMFETQAERDAVIPPAPPPMPVLSPRQIRLALLQAGKLAQVETALNAMSEPQKSQAKIIWEYAIEFERTHPLVQQLGQAIGLTSAQIDTLWQQAAQL